MIIDSQTVVVKSDVAVIQLGATIGTTSPQPYGIRDGVRVSELARPSSELHEGEKRKIFRRYSASVTLDPNRPSKDMGRVAEEVLLHLSTLPGAKLKMTVEIEAEIPDGVPSDIQRIVLENGNTLKFRTQAFEESLTLLTLRRLQGKPSRVRKIKKRGARAHCIAETARRIYSLADRFPDPLRIQVLHTSSPGTLNSRHRVG